MINYLSSLDSRSNFVMEAGISIFCTITFSENLYNDTESMMMLDTVLSYLDTQGRIL